MVVKNLRTIGHTFRKTDFYCCTYICKCMSSFCRLEERGMGITPAADTINGTTYSALCFHVFYFHCKIMVLLILLLLLLLLLWIVWFSMVDLTVLLVVHCHTECQTIGLVHNWKGWGWKKSSPNLRYYIASFLQDFGKQQDFNQEN